MKLGKLSPIHDLRTLRFEKYIVPHDLPMPPEPIYLQDKVQTAWGMMGNDVIGDCTCAAAGHHVITWTANAQQTTKVIDDMDIIHAYSAVSGYDPVTGNNDKGANALKVLKMWRTTGIGQNKITAFTALEYQNERHVREAVNLFGGCYVGLQLPVTAKGQSIWEIPPQGPIGQGAPESWDGHAVPVIGYDSRYLYVVTWGSVMRMTYNFYKAYCDEAYAIISADWIAENGTAPTGFDLEQLLEDLHIIAS